MSSTKHRHHRFSLSCLSLLTLLSFNLLLVVDGSQTILATDPLVQKLGRPYLSPDNATLQYEWLGSGFRLSHTGTTLLAKVAPTTASYKITYSQLNENFFPFQGISWVTPTTTSIPIVVANGPGVVRVTLNVPPQYWAPSGTAGIISFTTDGKFLDPPPRTRNLHFLGDSITAATNIHGLGIVSCADSGYEADYASSWAGLVCSAFDADCTTVAVGGKGLVRNGGGGGPLMPEYYVSNKFTDLSYKTDFSKTKIPDGMVVFLGTNDYIDPIPGLDAMFTEAFLKFMYNVSRVWYGTTENPANITFLATLGPMQPVAPSKALTDAVMEGKAQGYKVELLNVTTACGPLLKGCSDGCASHPGVIGHRSMADGAILLIKKIFGW